jgi:uncharacterized protein (TIGR02118 family)
MLKLDILIVRNPNMTHDQFLSYWRDRHALLFSSQPIVKKTVRRYVQSRIVSNAPQGAFLAPFDGIAQIWYDNVGGFLEYVQSSNYKDVIRPDEERFTDPRRVQFIFSEETPIIG